MSRRPGTVGLIGSGIGILLALGLVIFLAGGGKHEAAQVDARDPSMGAVDTNEPSVNGPSQDVSETVARVIAPATRPATPLPPNASCVTAECHATLAEAEHIHGPVSTRQCLACHAPDTGGHKYPLLRPASETCAFCHTVSGTMKNQHKGLEKGCITCHQPHVSKAKFLLNTESERELCQKCHQIKAKAFQHEPFGRGECSMCHAPHQSEYKSLLKGADRSSQCARCHEAVVRNASAVAHKHSPVVQDCVSCHSPHTSDVKHELKLPIDQTCSTCHPQVLERLTKAAFKHEPVTAGGQCATCHAPHGSNHSNMLRDSQDKLCMSCHDKPLMTADGREIPDMKPTLVNSAFRHGPVRAGECTPCHDSHSSDQKQLLRAEFPTGFYTPFSIEKYDLCFKCHEKDLVLAERTRSLTKFRDGESNLHYLHVNRDPKGRSCKSCHAVHGSDSPSHVAQLIRFDGSGWQMEMNFVATENGGSCQPGCHAKREYDRTRVTPVSVDSATQPTTLLDKPTTKAIGGEP